VKTHSQTLNKLAQRIGLGDNKGYTIAIAIALIIVTATVGGYYLATRPPPEGYTRIDFLDSQRGMDYPELLVIGQNNTFNVWVEVQNHMRKTQAFQVLLKITNNTDLEFPVAAEPKNTYAMTLADGETWKESPTITIDTPGNFAVVFELWLRNDETGELKFSGNACALNLEAVNQT
jgi:uncharacterized membrane protein